MNNKYFAIAVLGTLMALFASCSPTPTTDNQTSASVIAQYQQLEYQYNNLVYQLETQQAAYESRIAQIQQITEASYNSTISQLEQNNTDLLNQALQYRAQYENLIARVNESESYLTAQAGIISEVATLRYELEIAKQVLESMTNSYEEAAARTIACTPRDFASPDELTTWRIQQKSFGDNTTVNCRSMQMAAFNSGRILSVRTIDCIAFVGDETYKVVPYYDVELEDEEEFKCVWEVE